MPETLELVRFTVDPARREEFLRLRPAAIDALRAAYPGLLEARLAEQDDGSFIDVLWWSSREEAEAAAAAFPEIPAARDWAATISEVQEMRHATLAHRV
jgi:hypothetical protein